MTPSAPQSAACRVRATTSSTISAEVCTMTFARPAMIFAPSATSASDSDRER